MTASTAEFFGRARPEFAIPNATPGLKFLCRDTYDHGKPLFDARLAGRFEEMDCLVVFDDVLVPWERVFLYDSPELYERFFFGPQNLMAAT